MSTESLRLREQVVRTALERLHAPTMPDWENADRDFEQAIAAFDAAEDRSAKELVLEYQGEVLFRMASPDGAEAPPMAIFGLGIAGEAGEVADLIKKYLGHGERLDLAKLTKELGDVLWYATAIALLVNISLEDVMRANIAKLRARHPNGFTHATAQAKADETKESADGE